MKHRHTENHCRVITVYSDIFKSIQGHSAIFNHVQTYWWTLWYIEAYSSIAVANWAINPYIFTTMSYSKPWHGQNCLLKHFQAYSEIIRDIDPYSATLKHYSFRKMPHLKCIDNLGYVLHHTHSGFWHIRNYGYSGMFWHFQAYPALFRHIHAYWGTIKAFTLIQAYSEHCVNLAYSQTCLFPSPVFPGFI